MNWQQACDDPTLNDLPYRIELNRWGQLVMSRINNRHSVRMGEISRRLRKIAPRGRVIFCAAVNDVFWQRRKADEVKVDPKIPGKDRSLKAN